MAIELLNQLPQQTSTGEGLSITSRALWDGVLVSAAGEISFDAADVFDAALTIAASDRPALLVIDLSAVTFISSTAMCKLIKAQRRAIRFGGRIAVVAPPSRVREVLETARINTLVDLFATLDEAVA